MEAVRGELLPLHQYPREAARVLHDMQMILILACEERWDSRQEAYNAYETRTGKKLAEKKSNWKAPQGHKRKKRSKPVDEEVEASKEQKRQPKLDEHFAGFAGAHVSKGEMGSIRNASATRGGLTPNRATGRGRGSRGRGRGINKGRGRGNGGMAARGNGDGAGLDKWLGRR